MDVLRMLLIGKEADMDHERVLYRGEAFTLTGNALWQDEAHWAEVKTDGGVDAMKNGSCVHWHIDADARQGPRYHGEFEVLNKVYELALQEAGGLVSEDGLFRTGANWPSVWTRDIAYATHLGLGLWNVKACMESLRSRVKGGEVEQDTGTGGSWPISSDRVVWAIAAWEVYCLTGCEDWLSWSCDILERTCVRDEQVLTGIGGLIKGESSFLDWREQSYPAWMSSADIGESCSLSTMVLHMASRRILSRMFRELGRDREMREWEGKALSLSGVIERFFRLPGSVLHGQYLYGRGYPVLSEKVDCLGELLCVLLNQATGADAAALLSALPHCVYGIPCFHPQMSSEVGAYHNRAIWPFLEGYYAQASALTGNESGLGLALACMARAALLCGTNKENLLLETGLDDGLLLSSDSQLWSIAGMMGAFYKALFGIRLGPSELRLEPCVPESFAGEHVLEGVEFRGMILDIHLRGHGRKINRCTLNGQESPACVPADMRGRVSLVLDLSPDGEVTGDVNLAHIHQNLPMPAWLPGRHGIAWRPVDGADYYRVFRNGIPVSQTEFCYYLAVPGQGAVHYQVMAVAFDGRESYLNEPNEYPSADACLETRPCGLSGDEVWTSQVTESPDALFYNVNIAVAGVYRVDAFFANGTYDVSDGNTCALRSLYVNGARVGTLAFPHTVVRGNWDYFMYSTAQELPLQPGVYRVELLYDGFSENMNRLVNDMVIKHLRLMRIS